MKTTNPSEAYFEKVAQDWDSMRAGYFTEKVREAAIAKAYLHPEMIVADVGAGTGFMAAGLAPLVKQVYVLDGSPAMLEVARKNLAQFSNVDFKTADGLTLPLEDDSVDAVFANMYLHHCPDPLAAIHEMQRILRPGGRLVITDMEAHPYENLRTEMADIWLGFERSQLRSWFEEAELVNLVLDSTGQKCQSETKSQAGEQADINIFVASGTKRVAARQAVQESYSATALGTSCGCGGGDESCCTPGETSEGSGSCCSTGTISLDEVGTVNWVAGYSVAEKSAVPEEAADFSLGCGNPTAMANLRPGETVLDIGSGGGLDAFLAAKQVGPSGRVIGVDMTPAMLQRARRAAKKSGFENVTFKHGYAEKLPVKDGTVDVIISNCVINLAEDKGKVFNEAYRALKAGGRLEVNDVVFSEPVLPAVRSNAQGWAGCISGALPEAEYVDLVKQAGFKDVAVRRSTSEGVSYGTQVYSVQVSAKKV